MTNRESRIRALAGQCVFETAVMLERMGHDWETALDMAASHSSSTRLMNSAARIIDAIDALPVPGEPIPCGICVGFGTVLDHGVRVNCPVCNGTGKASE